MGASASILPLAPRRTPISVPDDARAMLMDLACEFAATGGAVYESGHTVPGLSALLQARLRRRVELVTGGIVLRDASVAIMVGSLHEAHPLQRASLLADVYRSLRPGGCALILEVSRSRDSLLNNLFAQHSRDNGRGGSRDVGEAIQIATTLDEERALLVGAGFRSVELFYKRYALCGFVAIK